MSILERVSAMSAARTEVGLGLVFGGVLVAQAVIVGRSGGAWPIEILGGGAICAAALLRRRDATMAAALGLAIAGGLVLAARLEHVSVVPNVAGTLGLCVLGCAAMRVASPLPAAAIAATGMAILLAGRFFALPVSTSAWADTRALGWAAVLGVGLWLRSMDSRRRAAIEEVRRAERLALARELHDEVAHHVTGVVLGAQAARIVVSRQPEVLDDALAGIESAGTDALTAMRRLVGLLRDPEDAVGVSAGPEPLADLVRRFAATGADRVVHLELPETSSDQSWPPELATTVYRIVQEGLTNVSHHARDARSVTVTISQDARCVRVAITDDGGAADSRVSRIGGGYGLTGMRERVKALGGTLDAGPLPRTGWAVRVVLPFSGGGP